MGKNDINQIADNVCVVHVGCGVNVLPGLQSRINSMYCSLLVGLISAAHQAILRLSSVSYP
ncbi:enterobactin synthetase component D [Escherichia coli]|nr:enterobactin synthetase component D [Escherichia coli]